MEGKCKCREKYEQEKSGMGQRRRAITRKWRRSSYPMIKIHDKMSKTFGKMSALACAVNYP